MQATYDDSEESNSSTMKSAVKRFLAAVRFLTIIPVYGEHDDSDIGQSTPWFMVVGVIIGLLCGGLLLGLGWLKVPATVSAVATVMLWCVITGGLHMDGLADSADGLLSHRPRERALEIMRDSRIGAMGVLALIFLILLKVTALISLLGDFQHGACAVALAVLTGRAVLAGAMSIFPYAREDGLAGLFMKHRRIEHGLCAAIAILPVSWVAFGLSGVSIVIITGGLAWCFGYWCKKKLGGMTGDTLGAVCELSEACVLVGICFLNGRFG